MQIKYEYDFCKDEESLEETEMEGTTAGEKKHISEYMCNTKKKTNFLLKFLFLIILILFLYGCYISQNLTKNLKDNISYGYTTDASKFHKKIYFSSVVHPDSIHYSLPSASPPRRLRSEVLRDATEFTYTASFLFVFKYMEYIIAKIFTSLRENIPFLAKYYYYVALNYLSKNRKGINEFADRWYELLRRDIMSLEKLGTINPLADKEYKKQWREIVYEQSKKVVEVSTNVFLSVCLKQFYQVLYDRKAAIEIVVAIKTILRKKMYKAWITEEDIEAEKEYLRRYEKRAEVNKEVALQYWDTLLKALSPAKSMNDKNNSIDERTEQILKMMWIMTLNNSDAVILNKKHRIDYCIIAYGKCLKALKKNHIDKKEFQVIDADKVIKAKSWADIEKIVHEKVEKETLDKLCFETLIATMNV